MAGEGGTKKGEGPGGRRPLEHICLFMCALVCIGLLSSGHRGAWSGVVRCGVYVLCVAWCLCVVWCGVVWCDVVWRGVAWCLAGCVVAWSGCGAVCGVVWRDVVYGVTWCVV